ncbi:Lon protease [Actinomadura rubteroloni]|uniref:endopeptidase La n=1 Tax=Actinomadura rubteroloni TaxID=1926885 RepID=A0A2P4UID8_9ACTN|nr:PDZ domain-containing protein [Actinomadura rubteroloni]POM24781.1 Lon protease [Actinomadura rubteroloni]
MSRHAVTLTVASVLVLLLAAVASVLKVPYVELMPGPTSNTLGTNDKGEPVIRIDGRQTYPDTGHLNFTTVSFRGGPGARMDLLTILNGWLKKDVAVVPEETYFPKNQTQKQVDEENTREMADSQQSAQVAALRELGIAVPSHIVVQAVQKGKPADGQLRAGDEIVALDGKKVAAVSEVTARMSKRRPGSVAVLTVRRGGKDQNIALTTVASDDGKRAVVGVVLGTGYTMPFKINISVGDIGGPSAGLMFSLAIVDKLTPGALTGGKFIAGTGQIDPDGTVQQIGGIQQKMIAARAAGATIFLTPKGNCADAAPVRPKGLRLVRADNLHQARQALEALTTGKGAVPSCP